MNKSKMCNREFQIKLELYLRSFETVLNSVLNMVNFGLSLKCFSIGVCMNFNGNTHKHELWSWWDFQSKVRLCFVYFDFSLNRSLNQSTEGHDCHINLIIQAFDVSRNCFLIEGWIVFKVMKSDNLSIEHALCFPQFSAFSLEGQIRKYNSFWKWVS